MTAIPFIKMHGLGNDFAVIDARGAPIRLDEGQTRAMADRRTGVGFDQLLIVEAPAGGADAFMRIRNSDGSEVAACGNGMRCVAAFLMQDTGKDHVVVETAADVLEGFAGDGGLVTVDMGKPRLDWAEIPLSREQDTLHLDLALGPLSDPVAVSMGNPHAVFFVDDTDAVDLAALGPTLEHDAIFPERANVEVVQVLSNNRIRMRVWERGAGITQACGTGACAVAVAAARRALTGRKVEVVLDGGPLQIDWRDDDHVMMTGPAVTSYTGVWPNGDAR